MTVENRGIGFMTHVQLKLAKVIYGYKDSLFGMLRGVVII